MPPPRPTPPRDRSRSPSPTRSAWRATSASSSTSCSTTSTSCSATRRRSPCSSGSHSYRDALEAAEETGLLVVMTRGAQGATVLTARGPEEVPAAAVEQVVDTTGAGDLFAAGLLYGLTHGMGPVESTRLGGALRRRGHLAHGRPARGRPQDAGRRRRPPRGLAGRPREPLHRHRRAAQCGQVHPVQRAHQQRGAGGQLPVRHHRAQRRRRGRARSAAAAAGRSLRRRTGGARDRHLRRHRRPRARRVAGRGPGQPVPGRHPRDRRHLPGGAGLPRRRRRPRRRAGGSGRRHRDGQHRADPGRPPDGRAAAAHAWRSEAKGAPRAQGRPSRRSPPPSASSARAAPSPRRHRRARWTPPCCATCTC